MTKNTSHKRTIRAYMAEHDVNYTTAARAVGGAEAPTVNGPVVYGPDSARLRALRTAIATGDQTLINEALKASSPGPDPWDLAYALTSLSHDKEALAGRYLVNHEWDEGCELSLVTYQV